MNGMKFTRISKNECGKCPSFAVNSIKIIGIFIGVIIALSLMIFVNLRKTNDSETNVVIRIFTNYIQIITSAAALNLKWPT